MGSGSPNINIIWMGPALEKLRGRVPQGQGERVVHRLLPIREFPRLVRSTVGADLRVSVEKLICSLTLPHHFLL